MNILKEYTLDYIRHNKKSSVAIMIAIFIATTLLSAMSGLLYTFYTDEIRLIKEERGYWHAELFDHTMGHQLKYVTGHPNVESVMIKGTWEIGKIDDPRRSYLAMRGLNANYWKDMPEHTSIIEGRIPQSENEIALSKQYFENHPNLKVGDSITLTVGERIFQGQQMDFNAPFKEGERLIPLSEQTYTIVAKLDITTNSMTPYYLAYGYLEDANILPEDQLTVYMRFKNPRTTYEDIHRIAQSVGFKPDEYGDYMVKTNDMLLAKYLIFSPQEKMNFELWMFSQPMMIIGIALLVAGVFVFIINNAFAMSANARLRQLGILQSIGASPRQILRSMVFEGLVLSIIPIPLGIFLGWVLDYTLFAYINSVEYLRNLETNIEFTFGVPIGIFSAMLALLTVWMSVLVPARKISRISPLDAIRQEGSMDVKNVKKKGFAVKFFGIEGELAQNALYARRKSYKTASISLTLSFLLFTGMMNLMAVTEAQHHVYYSDRSENQQDITIFTDDGNITEAEFEKQIRSIEGVQRVLFASDAPAGLWISGDQASYELQAIGGLKGIADAGKYAVYEENGKFRIRTNLLTLDDESFKEYCKEIGVDSFLFYDTEVPQTILVNKVEDHVNSNRRNQVFIPFLKLNVGDILHLEEKIYLEDTSDYSFETQITFQTNQMPLAGDRYGGYQLVQVMPRSTYLKIVENFQEVRALRAKRVFAPMVIQSEDFIQSVADGIQKICNSWYGSGDYAIQNTLEIQQTNDNAKNLLKVVMLCIAVFLAFIGISNLFSTVSGNLKQRRKEFAMLRSLGISPKGIRRMLALEAVLFGLMPIVLSIPLNMLVVGFFLKINMIYISEFLPHVPLLPMVAFGMIILLSVVSAYGMGGKNLQNEEILEVLKDEAM